MVTIELELQSAMVIFIKGTSSCLSWWRNKLIEVVTGCMHYPEDLATCAKHRNQLKYIGVGEEENVQLFYFFVESEGNPLEDPLIIWLPGGPGCSNLHAFFFEIGPFNIQYGKYIDNVPLLQLDPNSWTKVANVIFLDAPTITGYSYTTTPEAARSSDTLFASQTVEFIRKFVRDHPRLLENPMYVTGISYSGIIIPMITEMIYTGNEQGLEPIINIKGYIAGNPLTNKNSDINSRFEYAYLMALISKELYESTKKDCNGEYVNIDYNNLLCLSAIDEVNERVRDINMSQILEPNYCGSTTKLTTENLISMGKRRSLRKNPINITTVQSSLNHSLCDVNYYYASLWANNEDVMKTLNVRKGRANESELCIKNMVFQYGEPSPLYEYDVSSSVVYHKELSKRKCRALIFSGDHDMTVPHVGTHNWIKSLNLEITDSNWDAWYSNGQVAGFKTTYSNYDYSLVFATMKGGGHEAPKYKRKECFDMVKRWFAHRPI